MPVLFLSTGLRTDRALGGEAVFLVAAVLLVASACGKLLGTHLAGNRHFITSETFTALLHRPGAPLRCEGPMHARH